MLVFFHQISWMSCCRERTECSTSGQWGSGGWTSASNMLCLNAAQNRCVLVNECILDVYVATSNDKAECIGALFHSVFILLRIRWSTLACIGIKSASWFASSIQLQLPFESVLSKAVCFFVVMIHFKYTGNDVILQTFATKTVMRTAIIMWPTKFKHHVYYRALPNISVQPLIFSPRLDQIFQPLWPLVVVFFDVLKEQEINNTQHCFNQTWLRTAIVVWFKHDFSSSQRKLESMAFKLWILIYM